MMIWCRLNLDQPLMIHTSIHNKFIGDNYFLYYAYVYHEYHNGETILLHIDA